MVLLPRLLVLTDRAGAATRGRSLVETVAASVGAGAAAAMLFREKDLDPASRMALAADVSAVVAAVGCPFGVASGFAPDAAWAWTHPGPKCPSDATEQATRWVHLAQRDAMPDRDDATLVGRSCHNLDEVRAALAQRCDYVIVSPVAITASKPGYGPALGPLVLATLVEAAADMPVWVLGGVTPSNTAMWLRAGAYGIAVMGGIMAAADPAVATTEYLEALGACL
jgi:thiamine monophosphate synthase